jgi:hypothetical protein
MCSRVRPAPPQKTHVATSFTVAAGSADASRAISESDGAVVSFFAAS